MVPVVTGPYYAPKNPRTGQGPKHVVTVKDGNRVVNHRFYEEDAARAFADEQRKAS